MNLDEPGRGPGTLSANPRVRGLNGLSEQKVAK